MEGLKKSFLVRGNNIVGFSDKNFSTAPIGTVLSFAGQTAPNGYLLCNGASYKIADYPDLYAVIGNTYGGDTENFNVPDYRETVLVGIGENTTDTIASHDVYGLGEFKDDQLQGHEHNTYKNYETNATGGAGGDTIYGGVVQTPGIVSDGTNGEPRKGTTTHGKQKGVTYIIKAFHTNEGVDSGVSDDVVKYVDGEIAELETKLSTKVTDVVILAHKTQQYIIPKKNYQYGLPISIDVPEDVTFVSIISCNCTSSFCNVSLTGGLGKNTTIDVSNVSDWEEKTFVNILYLCVKK